MLGVAVALITNSREAKAGSSGPCGGSGKAGREGDVGAQFPAHSSSPESAALCTRLIKMRLFSPPPHWDLALVSRMRVGPVSYSEHDCSALPGSLCLT